MSRAVASLKCTGAVIVFVISYVICSVIAHIVVRFANLDVRGLLIDFLPYFAAFVAGYLSVYGGLLAVERFFPTVRQRTVAWVFIGLMGFLWGLPLLVQSLGLAAALVGLVDVAWRSHTFLTAGIPPEALQGLVAVIAAWKMTAAGGDFEPQ